MDVVGLGMGITDAVGMAIFLGLNGALYQLLAQTIGSNNFKKAGVYRQRGRFILIVTYILLIPFYVFCGPFLKLCG